MSKPSCHFRFLHFVHCILQCIFNKLVLVRSKQPKLFQKRTARHEMHAEMECFFSNVSHKDSRRNCHMLLAMKHTLELFLQSISFLILKWDTIDAVGVLQLRTCVPVRVSNFGIILQNYTDFRENKSSVHFRYRFWYRN